MARAGAALRQKKSAERAFASTVSTGISSWQRTFPVPTASTVAFAPGTTTIWFSPSAATRISAMPVSPRRSTSISTPASRRPASASSAKSSSPTAP
jgi:hypothetical protein